MTSDSNAHLTRHYSVPGHVRDSIKQLAANNGETISAQAVLLLERALPRVTADLSSYKWPATRREYQQRGTWATIVVHIPKPVFREYQSLAMELTCKAVAEGRYYAGKDDLGEEKDSIVPTDWLMRRVLHEYTPRTVTVEDSVPIPPPGVSDGPLVLVSLPASAVDWMLRGRYNRSAFIRSAIETQLPVLAGAQTIPPMSRLMPDAPAKNTPVRMSTSMHATLKATAKTKGVSMTHLMRAACLTHLAAKATKPTAQPA